MSSTHRRGPWSQQEDAYLCQLVQSQGALNWVRIAQLIGTRSPKQCRERYHQNLKPSLNHAPISPEEGVQIEQMVEGMGKRWAEIARRLHGRSDNAVKNWWNGSMNRRKRLDLRRQAFLRQPPSAYDETTSPPPSYAGPPAPAPAHRYHHHHQPHPLSLASTTTWPSQRGIDGPLPSPAVSDSEASRAAESLEGAPSLVSDASSAFSGISDNSSTFASSPRGVPSPSVELPSLPPIWADDRRPSLPQTPSGPPPGYRGGHMAYPSGPLPPRFHDGAQPTTHPSPGTQPPPSDWVPPRWQQSHHHMPPRSPPTYCLRSPPPLFLTAPPTPVQLPPLQLPRRTSDFEPHPFQPHHHTCLDRKPTMTPRRPESSSEPRRTLEDPSSRAIQRTSGPASMSRTRGERSPPTAERDQRMNLTSLLG